MNTKKMIAWMLLASMAGVAGLGGCGSALSEAEEARHGEACVAKQDVCSNLCYKAALGWSCSWCCRRAGVACIEEDENDFASCLK